MRDKLVIIPCGKKKIWDDGVTKGQVRAGDAYTGTLFKLGVRYAQEFDADWVILSAKYGYISPEVMIEPYDVTFSRKASNPVSYKELSTQLFELKLLDYKEVIALGGAEYRKAVIDSFACGGRTEIKTPFTGLRIGEYLHAMKEAIELEMFDNEARTYNMSEPEPIEIDESGKITFLCSYWKLPTVESAFSGWLEGKPTKEEEKWEYFKIKVKRETWLDLGPKPGAWDQLIEASYLIGKKVLIQMWDPWGFMFLDEEEAQPLLEALFTEIKLIHDEAGFLQCYMCLKDVQSQDGWDGSPRVKHSPDGPSLLSLGEIYKLSAIEK
jgi:hypothetical protein